MFVNGKCSGMNGSKLAVLQMCSCLGTGLNSTSLDVSFIQLIIIYPARTLHQCVSTTRQLPHPSRQRGTSEEPRNPGTVKGGPGPRSTKARKSDNKVEASSLDAEGGVIRGLSSPQAPPVHGSPEQVKLPSCLHFFYL